MTLWRLVVLSLLKHWRSSLAVAAGVMAGTAVLTGALLVGDSVRGSMRDLVLDRLGRIDEVLVTDRFFRAELADELRRTTAFRESFSDVVPSILLEATVQSADSGRRANQVNVLGADAGVWDLSPHNEPLKLKPDEIAINQPLAEELQVAPGDSVLLRMPAATEIPADSPLGRKTETVRNRRLTVAAIVPAEGLGQFSLRPSQETPLVAIVAPDAIQRALEQSERFNALLIAGRGEELPSRADEQELQAALKPELADYNLAISETPRGYFNLTSQRMLLDPPVVEAARKEFPHAQPAFVYLANTIAAGDREIPYSTVAALDPVSDPPLGPLETTTGEPLSRIGDDEIVLNEWAAEDLEAKPGDTIKLVYFRPDTTHGRTEEATVELKLAQVVKMTGAAVDPSFTPEVKGITDEKSIADWDPPFPFEAGRVRSQDEEYWDQYRGTPKAFVSLATGQRLWGSRFGDVTTIRIPPQPGDTPDSLAARLKVDPERLGFAIRPVKRQALAAASGTTPFDALFLGFSFFIILAALLLVALLFRLAIETRASEVGVLRAVGLSTSVVRRLWLVEGFLIAALGSLVGVALGVGYAWLMTAGLNTWWVAAVSAPFVKLHIYPLSLTIGFASGLVIAWLTIAWSLRRLRRVEISRLLKGELVTNSERVAASARWPSWLGAILIVVAIGMAILGSRLSAEAQAGAFMGSGALVLAALLLMGWNRLGSTGEFSIIGSASPARIALRNSARNRARSMLAAGLVAAATFLIVAISAFRLEPPAAPDDRNSGTGGYSLVAASDQPIYENPREALDAQASAKDRPLAESLKILPIRVRTGDDASCLNLFAPQQPRVLGMPPEFIERGGFVWAGSLADTPAERANPWILLEKDYGATDDGRPILPIVIDAATALYSLHLKGVGAIYELPANDGGPTIPCQVVGLLKNSVLQGSLIASEAQFLRQFPDQTGFRFFLVDVPPADAARAETLLERTFGDYGLDAQNSADRLADFLVVQNTYLSTFQSLGGLGLLLGTIGLAVVELRNVLERRGELALLRAVGFRRRWLAGLVLSENLALLLGGLAIGLVAALVAVSPHLLSRDAGIPWASLFAMLGLIALVGFLASLAAVRAVLSAPVVPALRGD